MENINWIAITSVILAAASFIFNLYGARQRTLREGREDARDAKQDMEEQLADCEKARTSLRQQLAELREENLSLLQRLFKQDEHGRKNT